MTQEINAVGVASAQPSIGAVHASLIERSAFHRIIYRDDLNAVFMNLREFAEPLRYYHSSLAQFADYAVLFDNPHTSANFGNDVEFNTIRPQFQISEDVLRHRILRDDFCIVRGVRYQVQDFVSDGVGVTTVFLRVL